MCPDGVDAALYERASRGEAAAQCELGEALLALGAAHAAEAARWFRAGAESGHGRCALLLSRALAAGDGVARDKQRAVQWLRRAAEAEDPEALFELSGLVDGPGSPPASLSSARAYELALRSAQLGHAPAMSVVAVAYDSGMGALPQSDRLAVEWYTKAAERGVASAAYNLGCAYKSGQHVKADGRAALRWWTQAAEGGHAMAMRSVGLALVEGEGAEADPAEGVRWMRKASRRGDTRATFLLAHWLSSGEKAHQGVLPDPDEAERLFARLGGLGGEGGVMGAMLGIIGSGMLGGGPAPVDPRKQARARARGGGAENARPNGEGAAPPPGCGCLHCGAAGSAEAPLKACARCHSARFCSRECQKAAWKAHKRECAARVQEASAQAQLARESAARGEDAPEARLAREFAQAFRGMRA